MTTLTHCNAGYFILKLTLTWHIVLRLQVKTEDGTFTVTINAAPMTSTAALHLWQALACHCAVSMS